MASTRFRICAGVDLHGSVGFQIYSISICLYQNHESIYYLKRNSHVYLFPFSYFLNEEDIYLKCTVV
jgi:hypothetical protein